MNRFNQLLIAALAVQIVIAGGIYVGNQPPADDQVQLALLRTDKSEVDRITITEGDGKKTVLGKVDGKWQLPEYHHLPANQSKVNSIFSTLETTKSGWPVATTESSRERFQVADENFQKKVVLGKGDEALQTLYLGTSPGFRQLHMRRADEDEVYAVKLNSYDFPAQHSSWLDTALLQPGGDTNSLSGPGFAFIKNGDNWQVSEGDGEAVKEEIESLANALARLSVQSAEDATSENSDYEVTVKTSANKLHYRFFKQDNNHYVSRDDYPLAFRINKSDYEKITGQNATKLVKHTVVEKEQAIADGENTNSPENLTTSDSEQEVVPDEKS